MKMLKKIQQRLNSARGMTLFEMLTAVMIMLLVTGITTSVITLAMHQQNKLTRASEATILFSTLQTMITDELSYGNYTGDDNTEVTEFSGKRFTREQLAVEDPDPDSEYGVIVAVQADNPENTERLVEKNSYPSGMGAKIDSIVYHTNGTNGAYYSVKLSVDYAENDSTDPYLTKTFEVPLVN